MKGLFLALGTAALLFMAPVAAQATDMCVESVWLGDEMIFLIGPCSEDGGVGPIAGDGDGGPGVKTEPIIIIEDSRVEMERVEQQRRLIEQRKRALAQRDRS